MAILMSPRKFKRFGNAFSIGTTPEPKTVVISFVNYDGTVLQSSEVTIGEMPVYSGETPVREETEEFIYTFTGWDSEIVEATEDKTYTAGYSEEIRTYLVTYQELGKVIDTENVPYGKYPLKSKQVLDTLNEAMVIDYNNEDYAYTFLQKIVPVTKDTDYDVVLDDDPDVNILFAGPNGEVKHFLKRGYIRVRSNLGSIRIADRDVGGGEGVLGTQMYFGSTEKNNKETDNWILNWGRYDTKFHVPDIEEWYAFIKIVESIGITTGQGELLQMFNMYYVKDEELKQQGMPFYQWGGTANGYWSRTPVGAGSSYSNPNDLLVGFIEPALDGDGLYETYFRNIAFGGGATFCLRLFYNMPFEDTENIFPYVSSSHDQTDTFYPIMQIGDINFLKATVSYVFSLQNTGNLNSFGLFYREVISLSNSNIFYGTYSQITNDKINMSREYLDMVNYQDRNGLYITAGVPTVSDSGGANGWIIAKLYPSTDSSSGVKLYDRGVQASWANGCSGKISLTIDFKRKAFILSGYLDTNPGRGSPFHDEFQTEIGFNEILAKWSNFYYLLFKRYIIMPTPVFGRSHSGDTVTVSYTIENQ